MNLRRKGNKHRIWLSSIAVLCLSPTLQAVTLPQVPDGAIVEQILNDPGFETSDNGLSQNCALDAYNPGKGLSLVTDDNVISGEQSALMNFPHWIRCFSTGKNLSWGKGDTAHSLTFNANVKVLDYSSERASFRACAIAYTQSGKRIEGCQDYQMSAENTGDNIDINVTAEFPDPDDPMLKAYFELRKANDHHITAIIDDAQLYLIRERYQAEIREPEVPEGFELVTTMSADFEADSEGFDRFQNVSLDTTRPISGTQSLTIAPFNTYTRYTSLHEHWYNNGPVARSIAMTTKVRVESDSVGNAIDACVVAYLIGGSRVQQCEPVTLDAGNTEVMAELILDAALQQVPLARVYAEFRNVGGRFSATFDDTYVFIVAPVVDGIEDDDTGDSDSEPDTDSGDSSGSDETGNDETDLTSLPNYEAMPDVPEGMSMFDLIEDNGCENSTADFGNPEGSMVVEQSSDAILDNLSCQFDFPDYTRINSLHRFDFEQGPQTHSITTKAIMRIDHNDGATLEACAVGYQGSNRFESCQLVTAQSGYEMLYQTVAIGGEQLDRVMFEIRKLGDAGQGQLLVTLDDVHLFLVGTEAPADSTPENPPGGNNGQSGDLSLLGYTPNPAVWRNIADEIYKDDDVSDVGEAANDVYKSIEVALHPTSATTNNDSTIVSFGLPLAPGTLVNSQQVKVLNEQGQEIPAHVSSLLNWVAMPPQDMLCEGLNSQGNPGIRSVLIQVPMQFSDLTPKHITVEINNGVRTQNIANKVDVRETLVEARDGTYNVDVFNQIGFSIVEPAVIAAVDHQHLACTGMEALGAAGTTRAFMAKIDQAVNDFAYSIVDKADQLQDWQTTDQRDLGGWTHQGNSPAARSSAWLYQRPMALLAAYRTSGDAELLREAYRAMDHYAQLIYTPEDCTDAAQPYCTGMLSIRNPDATARFKDSKYSYNETLFNQYLLLGDERYLDLIGYISWGMETHTKSSVLNQTATARHAAYAFAAALYDGMLTNNSHQRNNMDEYINSILAFQSEGLEGFGVNGCYNYKPESFIGTPHFSPWMTSLLTDELLTAYQETGHSGIPGSLVLAAQCQLERGIVEGDDYMRWDGVDGGYEQYHALYTARSFGEVGPVLNNAGVVVSSPEDHVEHNLDGARPLALGAYFSANPEQKLAFANMVKQLMLSHGRGIDHWTRNTVGREKHRMAPNRKFAWQYGSIGKISWSICDEENQQCDKPRY